MAKDQVNKRRRNTLKDNRRSRSAFRARSGVASRQASTKGPLAEDLLKTDSILENRNKKTSDIVKEILKVNPVKSTKIGRNGVIMRSKALTKKKLRQIVKSKKTDIGRMIAKGVLTADTDMSIDMATEAIEQDEKAAEVKILPARNRLAPNDLPMMDPSQLSSTGTTLGAPAQL